MNKYQPSERTQEIIDGAFVFHPVHGDQAERYTEMRARFKELAEFMARNCPESAELKPE